MANFPKRVIWPISIRASGRGTRVGGHVRDKLFVFATRSATRHGAEFTIFFGVKKMVSYLKHSSFILLVEIIIVNLISVSVWQDWFYL